MKRTFRGIILGAVLVAGGITGTLNSRLALAEENCTKYTCTQYAYNPKSRQYYCKTYGWVSCAIPENKTVTPGLIIIGQDDSCAQPMPVDLN